MALEGHATPDGTAAYAAAHPAAAGHYRAAQGLTLSSLGLGSYLGATDPAARQSLQESALLALRSCVNVLDTAANYRDQASERDLGRALRAFADAGGAREGVLVATKAGFLHGDCDAPDAHAWFHREYLDSGLLQRADLDAGHSLRPAYLLRELERSRANLGLDCIDVHFLHNPEQQLAYLGEARFYAQVEDAFAALEGAADQGRIRMYGVATWAGLRTPPGQPGHLSLVKLVHHAGQARMRAGGKAGNHHFRAVQLPVNLGMTEAALLPTQPFRFGAQALLDCARDLGLLVLASASLLQMRLAGRVPPEVREAFGTSSDAATLLQFTRSVPGVTTALVGMMDPAHAAANTRLAAGEPPRPDVARTLLGTGSVHGW